MHDVLSVAMIVATILISTQFCHAAINTLRNDVRADISSVCGEMSSLRGKVHSSRSELLARMDSIQRNMRDFYAEQARHDNRITALERAPKQR